MSAFREGIESDCLTAIHCLLCGSRQTALALSNTVVVLVAELGRRALDDE